MARPDILKVKPVTRGLNMQDDGSKTTGFYLSSDTLKVLARKMASSSGFTVMTCWKVKLQVRGNSHTA